MGVNGSKKSNRSPAYNFALEVIKSCCLTLLKPLMAKNAIYRKIVIGITYFPDLVTKVLFTPSGSSHEKETK
jgi:hypothetical protein